MTSSHIDGGWGWCIVLACFGQHVFVPGVIKAFGVLFVDLQRRYATSAWFLSLVVGVSLLLAAGLGPVATALSVRFSSRVVVFVGGLLISSGFIATAFVTSANWLFLTYSIVTGSGFGLTYAPCIAMVAVYFNKRRGLANGVGVSGAGFGCIVMALLIRYMVTEYGLRGAMCLVGGMTLNVTVCAMLLRPLDFYTKRPLMSVVVVNTFVKTHDNSRANSGNKKPTTTTGCEEKPLFYADVEINCIECKKKHDFVLENQPMFCDCMEKCNHPRISSNVSQNAHLNIDEDSNTIYDCSECEHNVVSSNELIHSEQTQSNCLKYCDFRLLQNPFFVIYVIGIVCAQFSMTSIFMMVPAFANDRHISDVKGSILPSIIGGTDTISRLLIGLLADRQFIPRRYIFSFSIITLGALSLILPFAHEYTAIAVVCGAYGWFSGSTIATMAVVIVDAAGSKNQFQAIGLVMLFQSLSLFPSTLTAGALRDVTGSWDASLWVTGTVAIVGGLIASLESVIIYWRGRDTRRSKSQDNM